MGLIGSRPSGTIILPDNDTRDRRFRLCISLLRGILATFMAIPSVWASTEDSLFDLSLTDLLDVRVVTAASGFEQNLSEAPASVTIIEAQEWQAMGVKTLLQAIKGLPGIHVGLNETGLMYEKPIIRGLSGSFGQQVLLLVDGLPFRSSREGGAPWAQTLSLNGFQRIEIIRGSGSAIYGADAVGGIINLVSYPAKEMPTQVTLEAGEFGHLGVSLSKHLSLGDHDFQFAWSSRIADGDPDRKTDADIQTFRDQVAGTNASRSPGAMDTQFRVNTFKAAWQHKDLKLSLLSWDAPELGHGPGLAFALDPSGSTNLRSHFINGDYDFSKYVKGDLSLRVYWQSFSVKTKATLFPAGAQVYLDAEGNILPPSLESPHGGDRVLFTDGVRGHPGSDGHTYSVQVNHIFDLSPAHKLRWAVGFENSDVHPTEAKNFGPDVYQTGATTVDGNLTDISGTDAAYLSSAERRNSFIALQDQWQINSEWVANLGVRYDRYDTFGDVTNPRLGLVWTPNRKLSVKMFAGSAFRAPSFVDLYTKNNPSGIGNPDLEPESVEMIDLGFSANYVIADALHLQSSFFQYSANKLISFVPRGLELRAENSGHLKVRGIEHEVSWRSGEQLSVNFNVTLLDPYNAKDVDVSSIPQTAANLNLHYHREALHGYLGAKWVAQRRRAENDIRADIDDYVWLTGRIQYTWKGWEYSVLLDNLTDADAREPTAVTVLEDHPLAGRQAIFQVTHRF